MEHRSIELLRSLLRFPQDLEMLLHTSQNFSNPYAAGMTQLKADIKKFLNQERIIGRERLNLTIPGQGGNAYMYFPKAAIRRYFPYELRRVSRHSGMFRGITDRRDKEHSYYLSLFNAHFERSIGELKPRIEIIAYFRDGHFMASVPVENQIKSIVPDATYFISVDGRIELLFFELQNRPSLNESISGRNYMHSTAFKCAKYKTLKQVLQAHPVVQRVQQVTGKVITGARVLFVTTGSPAMRDNLIAAIPDQSRMFHVTTLGQAKMSNHFSDSIWKLPSGQFRNLLD